MRKQAPFEIMNRPTVAASQKAGEAEGDADGAQADGGQGIGDRLKHPHAIVLRVPPGQAVFIGIALICLLVVGYLVGYANGKKSAVDDYEAQEAQRKRERDAAAMMLAQGGAPANPLATDQADAAGNHTAAGSPGQPSSTPDPLTVGLNYFIVARYPRDAAFRLKAFLDEHQVEVAVIPVHNNRNLFHVVALRGFASGETSSESRKDYERMLKRLGREWKRDADGPDDLSSMYLKKHDG